MPTFISPKRELIFESGRKATEIKIAPAGLGAIECGAGRLGERRDVNDKSFRFVSPKRKLTFHESS